MPQVPGNTISGAGGYGSYPGNLYSLRYDWLFRRESAHLGTSLVVGIIARNPYVSVGLGVLHGLTHVKLPLESGPDIFTGSWFREFPGLLGSLVSPGGGGLGQSLTSTATPPSVTEVGRMITGKPGKPSKRDSFGCPPGYYSVWSHRKKRYVCLPVGTKDEYKHI